MKSKKGQLIVVAGLVLNMLAQPTLVLATQINSGEVQHEGLKNLKAVSNPNLMNISSKSVVTGTNIWGNANRWQMSEWSYGLTVTDKERNDYYDEKFGFTDLTSRSDGQKFKMDSINVNVIDNKSIDIKASSTRYNGIVMGQYIDTEIGKEYTVAMDYNIGDRGTIDISANKKWVYQKQTGKNTKAATFVADKSKTFIGFHFSWNSGLISNTINISNFNVKKSEGQLASEELELLLETFFDQNGNLNEQIVATDLTQAQLLLDKVSEGNKKNELKDKLDRATELLKQRDALTAVSELFSNNDVTSETIKDTVTQATLDSVQSIINKVTEVEKAKELMAYWTRAEEFFNQNKAAEALKNLFVDNDVSNDIKESVTQESIDQLNVLINKVTDEDRKALLIEASEKAQQLLNARIEEENNQQLAESAVNGLFKDNNPASNAIINGLAQWSIDKAMDTVKQVKDEEKKNSLLESISTAQTLLNERIAEEAKVESIKETIADLFQDKNTSGSIREDLTQEEINHAITLTETIKDATIQKEQLDIVNQAQLGLNQLNAEKETNAEDAVNGLFQNNDPATETIKGGITQETINKAIELTNEVLDEAIKAELNATILIAQSLLDERIAETNRQNKAQEAVNALFTENNPGTGMIVAGLTQETVDAAQALINAVTAPSKKEALQNVLNTAQSLLTKRIEEEARQKLANEAVNALFENNNPLTGEIVEELSVEMIESARNLAELVKDSSVKETLLKNIDLAAELLNQREIENSLIAAAEKEVNGLFQNNNPATGLIVEGLTQAHIDAAKAAVNKVQTDSKKAELLAQVETAQKELYKQIIEKENQEAAEKAVNELFKDNDPVAGIIKDEVTQADIDSAKELISLIKDQAKKEELLNKVKEVEAELHASLAEAENQVAAENAINNLFVDNSSETNELKDSVQQDTLNSAKELLSKVQDEAKKAELQEKLDQAQKLFDDAQNNELKPTINAVGPFQQAITGTVPVGTTMVRLLVNGVPQRVATPDEEGNFSIYSRFITDGEINTLRLQAGDKVTIDYGVRGNPLLASTVEVNKDFVKPLVNDVVANSEYVTGSVPIGSQVIRLLVNGVPQRTAAPQADINSVTVGGIDIKTGKFKIYSRIIKDENGKSRKLQAGDKVTIDSGVQIPGATGTTVTVVE